MPVKIMCMQTIPSEYQIAQKASSLTSMSSPLIDEYLAHLKNQNKSQHTIQSYEVDLRQLYLWMTHFLQKNFHELTSDDLSLYREYLKFGDQLDFSLYETHRYQSLSPIQKIWHQYKRWKKDRGLAPQRIPSTPQHLPHSWNIKVSQKSIKTQKRHLSAIKNFFDYLKETREDKGKYFLKNPVKSKIHSIKLKDADVTPTPMLTKDQFERCLSQTYRTREKIILLLLFYGGLRIQELTQLRFSDFDEREQSIALLRKGGDRHRFQLRQSQQIFKEIHFYRLHYGPKIRWSFLEFGNSPVSTIPLDKDGRYLFTNPKGLQMTVRGMFQLIKKILSRSQLPETISPHSFRKACATYYYLETKDLLKVRDYLNHKDATVTQTYIDKLTLN